MPSLLVALALTLAQLVPVAVPGGGTIEADSALAPALVLLAQFEEGRPLLAALARGGVQVAFAVEPVELWGEYQNLRRVILVHPSLRGADPRTLAALLAHEAEHARADLDGTAKAEEEQLGLVAASVIDEERASLVELRVWLALYGPGGMPTPRHVYEHETNAELPAYLAGPAEYLADLAEWHAQECAAA